MRSSKKAFTIMEIMTVVVIVGIISVFAVPSFVKTMELSHEQDAVTQLTALHTANKIYRAQNGKYWPPDINSGDTVAEINSALGLSLIESGVQYKCTGVVAGTTYNCRATRTSGYFMATITPAALGTGNPTVVKPCPYGYC